MKYKKKNIYTKIVKRPESARFKYTLSIFNIANSRRENYTALVRQQIEINEM